MKKSLLLLLTVFGSFLHAQQHPAAVEPAALLDVGHARFDLGLSYFRSQPFPLSGLTGHLLKFGNLRFAIALSEYVELQADGTVLNLLDVTRRDSAFNSLKTTKSNPTGDIGDFTVWTKFGILNEYRTGVGLSVRFGVQLPNASNESGLGIDEMNFFSSLLFQKHAGGLWTANVGLGILSDPTVLGQQHDVVIYGFSYDLPVGDRTIVKVQAAGRNGHSGTGIYHLANVKAAVEQQAGDFALTIALVSNFAASDKAKGVEFNLSYHFHTLEVKK